MSSKPTVEILVHTTAPSKASDDINYRHLAAAYLDFQPAVRSEIGSLRLSDGVIRDNGYEREPDEPRTGRGGLVARTPTFQQSFGFDSSNVSFGSADHNLISPELRRTQGYVQAQLSDSQSSWRAPPSVVADSNPENNISIAQYSSPTRILEHYLQRIESSQSSSSQPIPSEGRSVTSPAATRQATIPQSQTPAIHAPWQRPFPPTSEVSMIPQSPLLTGRKRTRQELTTSALKQTVIASSIAVPEPDSSPPRAYQPLIEVEIPSTEPKTRHTRSASLSAADCIPSSRVSETGPLLKRQRQLVSEANGSSLIRSSSDIGPRQDQVKRSLVSQRPKDAQILTALEIRSPEPPVSCSNLVVSDVVTPRLEKLAKDVKLDKRFEQRKKQIRELRPFERGYWLVDCASWPEEAKQTAWGFLGNYVGNGLAGWGIWCRRDEGFQTLRLYCWGCVAGYMFLVLWLSSQRELNYVKSIWIAGDGQAVITMEPKYKRP